MRTFKFLLLLLSCGTMGQPLWARDPGVPACDAVERKYGQWAVDLRLLLDRNSTDAGRHVNASLISDVNSALLLGKDFVHDNILYVQEAPLRGHGVDVQGCQATDAMARDEVQRYVEHLIRDVPVVDQEYHAHELDVLRDRLQTASRNIQVKY